MPVCPQCSATIHTGANDQCPACGYGLHVADEIFGDRQVEFTRVLDSAGALTHQQRQELLQFLESLERDIPPAALCIYITDDGRPEEFRTHAHWILNHARIHHPSFGRREQHKALEDAELNLRFTRDARRAARQEEHALEDLSTPEPVHTSWLSRFRVWLRDALHPHLPPPVNKAWMLILVLDVQLERACFSWGYQLDPYIDPNSINRCIVGAKFQFRERAMVTGLRRVMKAAVKEIASRSRRVNAQLRRTGRAKALLAFLAASLLLAPSPCSAAGQKPSVAAPAASAAAAPVSAAAAALPDDDVAEEVAPAPSGAAPASAEGGAAPGEGVAPAEGAAPGAAAMAAPGAAAGSDVPPPPKPGAPATYEAPFLWADDDYQHLMAGELTDGFSLLFPPADAPRVAPRFRSSSSQESDKKVLGSYCAAYKLPSSAGLCDPQGLLTVEERRDVEYVLRELNAHGRFRIYAALYRAGQQLPPELSVQTLTNACAQPCEYVALVLFPLGNSQFLDIGYQEVKPSDEDRHAWLARVRAAAAPEGDGVEALLLALREVHAVLLPLSSQFRSSAPEEMEKLPPITIEFRPDDGEKKVPFKHKLEAFYKDEANHPLIITVSIVLAFLSAALLFFLFRRRSGHLIESEEDVRLSSPYGAGVSRYVRYLEGKESPKETNIF